MAENKLTMTEATLNQESADLVNITINGTKLQVPKGENLIESAKRLGVDVPFFCYHPRLSKGDAGNCRMCLVDVATTNPDGTTRKMPKPQTACTMPASEGLVIETDSTQVQKDRKGVIELLLINHPLDCPICDRGGECPLQNNTIAYGAGTSRYIEEKRHFPKAYPLSDHVVFDRERCIHCARCTRFTEDISGDAQLGFLKRGADMEVGTFAHTAYNSKFSGNVIELCPVGALLSREYRFKARPWDLLTQRSVCSQCGNGCNIKIDYRLNQLQRVNARLNEEVNEEWTCDRGKFGHDYVSSAARLTTPQLKRNGKWTAITWDEAYRVLVDKLKAAGTNVGGIGGERCANEDLYAWQKLFRQVIGTNNLDHRLGRYDGPTNALTFDRFGYHGMGNSIADIEKFKSILVIGSELSDEQPIIFLRVRKAWRFKGASVVHATTEIKPDTTSAADFAEVNLVYRPGTEIALINGILNVLFAQNLLPQTPDVNTTGLQNAVADWTPERASRESGVAERDITIAANLLARGPMGILVTKAITEHPFYTDILAALGNLAVATGNGGNLNVPGLECNTQGASDMGILPDSGPGYAPVSAPGLNTRKMLEAAASGELDVLWLVGADLLNGYYDSGLARRALENAPFVVVNELFMTETVERADLVLPVASVAEKDGTYTNVERRVQRIYKAFDVAPDIKPDWLVFTEVASQLGGGLNYFSVREILREIGSTIPTHQGITPKSLGEAGLRWNYPQSASPTASFVSVAYTPPARQVVTG